MNIYENIGRIRVGDLVALKGTGAKEEGPVGIVLSEIVVTSFPVTGRKQTSLEYWDFYVSFWCYSKRTSKIFTGSN